MSHSKHCPYSTQGRLLKTEKRRRKENYDPTKTRSTPYWKKKFFFAEGGSALHSIFGKKERGFSLRPDLKGSKIEKKSCCSDHCITSKKRGGSFRVNVGPEKRSCSFFGVDAKGGRISLIRKLPEKKRKNGVRVVGANQKKEIYLLFKERGRFSPRKWENEKREERSSTICPEIRERGPP